MLGTLRHATHLRLRAQLTFKRPPLAGYLLQT